MGERRGRKGERGWVEEGGERGAKPFELLASRQELTAWVADGGLTPTKPLRLVQA